MQWLIYLLCPLMMILCMIGMFKGGKKETTPNHDVIKDNESLESLKVQMQGLIEQNKILTKEMIIAIIKAATNPIHILDKAISKSLPNAMYVEKITIGLINGPVNINPIAAGNGTPFAINLLTIGTIPHSQAGNKLPTTHPIKVAAILFLGIHFLT